MKKDNKKPIEVTRKPCKCPACGNKVVVIQYGEPTAETFAAEEKGELVIGGCLISPNSADWQCIKCGLQFIKVAK